MDIRICRIRAVADGAEAEISIELSAGDETQEITGTVLAEMLAELSLPAQAAAPLAIDRAHCDRILFCMRKTEAIRRGLYLLSFAQNTEKALQGKLMQKGFSREEASAATDYLSEKGFIDEAGEAAFLAETLAMRKLYGKSRIRKELYAKGFRREVIDGTLAEAEYDFEALCAERIRKAGGVRLFEARETRQKATASLLRYGFSYDDIRGAIALLRTE